MTKHRKKAKNIATMPTSAATSARAVVQKQTEIGRGTINHSALGALVTSHVFCMRVEKAKKGKGSFNRKVKHSGKECYQIAA